MCKDMSPLEAAIQFHGHICPGLLMGVRVAEFARNKLGVNADVNEELVAVVETDSCGVDAIQAILGCTFGKGNLIFKDYGKNVYTIASRESGQAIRVAQKFRNSRTPESQRYRELVRKDSLTEAEVAEKEELIGVLFEQLMSTPFEELFDWKEIDFAIPPKARIYATVQCARCGEGVVDIKATETAQGPVCPGCRAENGGR